MRTSEIIRRTSETDIKLTLNLDGSGEFNINSGVGFLDHMLELFARHSRFDLELSCIGDIHIDAHHTTEDIAICLGRALREALSDCRGITRYGDALIPMDEALILAAVDISGRSHFECTLVIPAEKTGDFDTELVFEFMQAFCRTAGITLHLRQLSGTNSHHIIEGAFKALARALRKAAAIDSLFADAIPSTKGTIV